MTERKSERAELVRDLRWPRVLSADLHPVVTKTRLAAADLIEADGKRLAAQDQKPVAWRMKWTDGSYTFYPPTAAGLIERDIAAQSALARIRKVRDGYANQEKFADVEQASYFREFIRRLDEAVSPKEGTPQLVPDHGGADAGVGERESVKPRKVLSLQDRTCDKCDGTGLVEGPKCCPQCLGEGSYEEQIVVECIAAQALSKPAHVAANASAELQNDLAEMLRALGMSDAAQPKSPHEVFQSALAEMKRQLANASAEARLREALAWTVSEIELEFSRNKKAFPADCEKKVLFQNAKALATHPHASEGATKSNETGIRVEDNPSSHGESLQQGSDTNSRPSTAETPRGKGSDAVNVANPVASSDLLVSHEAPVSLDPHAIDCDRFKHFAPDGGKAPIRLDAPDHLTIKTSVEMIRASDCDKQGER